MSVPTLSMRLAAKANLAKGKKRRRSEAAKKAWRTRRRQAKPSKTMLAILEWLIERDENRVYEHRVGKWLYFAGRRGRYHGCHRFTIATMRALKRRGWLKLDCRSDTGGILGMLPDGSHGIVEPSYDLLYRISDKGQAAIDKARKGEDHVN